ncbi:MAG: antibiotic biosynthesis monooxygenase [Acidimicrobiia bacterium]
MSDGDPRVGIITRLQVHAHEVAHAVDVFAAMQADVLANEPGTVEYRFYRDADDDTVFWVHELFADEAAKQLHLVSHRERRADFDRVLAEPAVFHLVTPL